MRVRLAELCIAALFAATAFAATGAQVRLADVAMKGDMEGVRSLIKQHVDVNAPQADGATALLWAAYWNDEKTVEALVAAGASVNATNRYGVTALSQACVNGNAAMVETLLKAGADANTFQAEGQTALMTAARSGSVEAAKALLDHGAEVNAKESWRGQTALMWAAAENHPAVVQLLVEKGAEVNARSAMFDFRGLKTKPGDVPMHFPRGGLTPLLFAARNGHLDCVRILLAAGADTKLGDPDGTTALILAIINGHYDTAAFLLEHGADPNAADENGRAPLFSAVDMYEMYQSNRPAPQDNGKYGSLDIVKLLLAHGANPNAQLAKLLPPRAVLDFPDMYLGEGATPFLRAAKSTDVPLMRLLLEKGADPKLTTKEHSTAVMMAAGMGYHKTIRGGEQPMEALQLCLELGLDVNAINDRGETAVHAAAGQGSDKIVQLLADKGAKLDVKDKKGRTPVDVALGINADMVGVEVHESTAALLRQLIGTASKDAGTN
jgi:uncharacterized protein